MNPPTTFAELRRKLTPKTLKSRSSTKEIIAHKDLGETASMVKNVTNDLNKKEIAQRELSSIHPHLKYVQRNRNETQAISKHFSKKAIKTQKKRDNSHKFLSNISTQLKNTKKTKPRTPIPVTRNVMNERRNAELHELIDSFQLKGIEHPKELDMYQKIEKMIKVMTFRRNEMEDYFLFYKPLTYQDAMENYTRTIKNYQGIFDSCKKLIEKLIKKNIEKDDQIKESDDKIKQWEDYDKDRDDKIKEEKEKIDELLGRLEFYVDYYNKLNPTSRLSSRL